MIHNSKIFVGVCFLFTEKRPASLSWRAKALSFSDTGPVAVTDHENVVGRAEGEADDQDREIQ